MSSHFIGATGLNDFYELFSNIKINSYNIYSSSNYIDILDGFQSNHISILDTNQSNYISILDTNQSNYIITLDSFQSNQIITLDSFQSNQIITLDSFQSNYISILDTNQSNHIITLDSNQSNHIISLDTNQSNYISILDTNQSNQIITLDGFQSNYISILDANQSNYISILDANQSNYISILDANQSNHIISLDEFQSNHIDILNANQSNYILTLDANQSNWITDINKLIYVGDNPQYSSKKSLYIKAVDNSFEDGLRFQVGPNFTDCKTRINTQTGRLEIYWTYIVGVVAGWYDIFTLIDNNYNDIQNIHVRDTAQDVVITGNTTSIASLWSAVGVLGTALGLTIGAGIILSQEDIDNTSNIIYDNIHFTSNLAEQANFTSNWIYNNDIFTSNYIENNNGSSYWTLTNDGIKRNEDVFINNPLSTNDSNLILHYTFDNNLIDSTANTQLSLISGSYSFSSIIFKKGSHSLHTEPSILFHLTKSGSVNVLNGLSNFSVSFWINFDDTTSIQHIIRQEYCFIIRVSGGNTIQVYINNNDNWSRYYSFPITLSNYVNKWSFWTFIIDIPNQIVYWYDDNLIKTGTKNGTWNFTNYPSTTNNFIFLQNGTTGNYILKGHIDDFRIYDKALTITEIENIYITTNITMEVRGFLQADNYIGDASLITNINIDDKTTDNLTEGTSNLYYTDNRFDNRLATKTTDNLTEGTSNLYYTDSRFNTDLNNNDIYCTTIIDINTGIITKNVGIGSALPQNKLDVDGTLSALTIVGGIFYGDGSGLFNLPTASSQWITNGTNIYYNSGNVGIGVINPTVKLQVSDNAIIGNASIGYYNNNTRWCMFQHNSLTSIDDYALLQEDNGKTFINCSLGQLIYFREGNANKMVLKGGNLGINSLNPIYKLEVIGETLFNVGRGDLYFENNTYDPQNGTGITLRTANNPNANGTTTDGNIFSVKSSGHASRLWVGQLLTSTGYNDYFGVGFKASTSYTEGNINDYEFMINTANNNIKLGNNIAIDWNTANTLHIGQGFTNTIINDVAKIGKLNGTNSTFVEFKYHNLSTNKYALLQASSGRTLVNSASGQPIEFREENSTKMILTGGKLGINTTTPIYELQVNGVSYANTFFGDRVRTENADHTYIHIPYEGHWRIYMLTSSAGWGGTSAANDLMFRYGLNDDWGEQWLRHNDKTNDDLDFTGKHRCISNDSNLLDSITSNIDYYQGMIVETTGYYQDINSSNIDFSLNIRIDSSLPIIKLCDTPNSKAVYGVISNIEDNDNKRVYRTGNWYFTYPKTDSNRVLINAVGEGAIWICNYNSDIIENGDYIKSSPIPGYGMLQQDDILHNFTVAKTSCPVNFIDETSPFYWTNFKHRLEIFNDIEYKCVFIGSSYHCS